MLLLDGMYLSFETDTGPDAVARAFPPGHLQRLRALKAVWDPAGLFRDNFYIARSGSRMSTSPASPPQEPDGDRVRRVRAYELR